jgi:hypothetical protein
MKLAHHARNCNTKLVTVCCQGMTHAQAGAHIPDVIVLTCSSSKFWVQLVTMTRLPAPHAVGSRASTWLEPVCTLSRTYSTLLAPTQFRKLSINETRVSQCYCRVRAAFRSLKAAVRYFAVSLAPSPCRRGMKTQLEKPLARLSNINLARVLLPQPPTYGDKPHPVSARY